MKRVLFLPLLVITLFACRQSEVKDVVPSDEQPSTVAKKPITISIADFLQHEEDLRTGRKTEIDKGAGARGDSAKICYLKYFAYDTTGGHLYSSESRDTMRYHDNWGTISDSLAPGKYTIILAAMENLMNELTWGAPNFGYITPRAGGPLGQIFVRKMQLTVDTTPDPVKLEVTLNRIVGQLTVSIEDALPASDPNGYMMVSVVNAAFKYELGTEMPGPPGSSQYLERIEDRVFQGYVFGSDYEFNVVINYRDKITGEERTKTIEHVTCHTNKKTVLSGSIYAAPQPDKPGFSVKLNQSWGTDLTHIYF
ncbi:hypothetical protein [Chitinophaga sp. CF418]|uniref:hypothetical protein n=1 Tax=Chitinophaga sp. CF418 TaxID=1855287 RepID=UPI000919F892|nr:hypothetical protein [Chitinophaga sp. CF418]SHN23934.1 hypothetical protein SAMN05216311_107211 [Chitinophaga sp. CF418]